MEIFAIPQEESSEHGVDFGSRANVRAFRRGLLVYAVAWLLALLGVSPVTAPFSTFGPGDAPQQGTSEHHSLDQFKTSKDKSVEFVSVIVFLTPLHVITAVIAPALLSVPARSDRRAVLRI